MNRDTFQKVLDKISGDPSCWNQHDWHCGTQHCFGGWAQILSGKEVDPKTARRDARKFLQLSSKEADYLFAGHRTLEDFQDFIERDRAGYDRAGYDRAGYDRDGYDRAGYDRDGYDRAEYNRAGYDRAG